MKARKGDLMQTKNNRPEPMQTVQIRMKSQTLEKLDKIAQEHLSCRTTVIREIVETYLQDYKIVKNVLEKHEKKIENLEKNLEKISKIRVD